jgi:signal transduction histidine kinase
MSSASVTCPIESLPVAAACADARLNVRAANAAFVDRWAALGADPQQLPGASLFTLCPGQELNGRRHDIWRHDVSPPQPFSVTLTTSAAVLELTPIASSDHGCWLATLPSGASAGEQPMENTLAAEIAHDLRMPLQAILGWVSLLRQWPPDAKRLDHALTVIERNTRLQGDLLNDLLDMTCPVRVAPARGPSHADLGEVVRSTIESLMPLARDCGIHVTVTAVATPVAVPVRAQDVARVAANLIANAIKFSRSGGSVECEVSAEGGWGRLIVRDEGRGISAGFLPRVFAAFYQERRTAGASLGLGLGLASVRHLVQLHGGTVRAESGGPWRGATFTVNFPLETAHANVRSESLRGALRKR